MLYETISIERRNKSLVCYLNWPTGGALCPKLWFIFTFLALLVALEGDAAGDKKHKTEDL